MGKLFYFVTRGRFFGLDQKTSRYCEVFIMLRIFFILKSNLQKQTLNQCFCFFKCFHYLEVLRDFLELMCFFFIPNDLVIRFKFSCTI